MDTSVRDTRRLPDAPDTRPGLRNGEFRPCWSAGGRRKGHLPAARPSHAESAYDNIRRRFVTCVTTLSRVTRAAGGGVDESQWKPRRKEPPASHAEALSHTARRRAPYHRLTRGASGTAGKCRNRRGPRPLLRTSASQGHHPPSKGGMSLPTPWEAQTAPRMMGKGGKGPIGGRPQGAWVLRVGPSQSSRPPRPALAHPRRATPPQTLLRTQGPLFSASPGSRRRTPAPTSAPGHS